MLHLISNALLFLLIICSVTLCGLGLLQLCGLRGFQQRIFLAPGMALAVSGILVAFIVILGIPVGTASPIIWLLWIVFASYGALHVRSALIDLGHQYILWISVLVTLLVSGGFLWYGVLDYLGSPSPDGWSYVSFGEYLRQYPKGTEGGLAPIYQYASHLSATRYVSSAILAALVPPWSVGVDTQMTVGPLLIWSIFSFSLSVAYAAQMANQRGLDTPVPLAVFFGVLAWVPHALHANNYDNLTALSFAPALFALALDRNLNRYGQIFLPAIFVAASIYFYPELSPLIIAAYGAVAVEDFFLARPENTNGANKRNQLLKYAGIVVVTLVVVSPYLRDAIYYFSQQMSATTALSGRPGEGLIPGLLDDERVWGEMWGFGSKSGEIVIGLLLSLIVLIGAGIAFARKYFSILLYLMLIGALFEVMVEVKHYDYGAYKILLLGWWAVAIVLAAGTKSIWSVASISNVVVKSFLRIAIILIVFCTISLWLTQQYKWARRYAYKTANEIREARDVVKYNGIVQVSVSDRTLNAWLVYQLRDARAFFTEFHGYMDQAHVRPLMARSKIPNQDEIQYILTDANSFATGDLVWKNGLFKLVKGAPDQQPPQIAVIAPNGQEVSGGVPFFWIGRESVSVVLTTPRQKMVHIDFEAIVGPSVGASVKNYPKIFIERDGQQLLSFDATQTAKTHTIRMSLSTGSNTLFFRHGYTGKVVPNGNGDPRTLLVGIKLNSVIVDDE